MKNEPKQTTARELTETARNFRAAVESRLSKWGIAPGTNPAVESKLKWHEAVAKDVIVHGAVTYARLKEVEEETMEWCEQLNPHRKANIKVGGGKVKVYFTGRPSTLTHTTLLANGFLKKANSHYYAPDTEQRRRLAETLARLHGKKPGEVG